MDTLGPRIMVNVGTQAASTSGLNPRDLAPLTNDAFLATFMGKASLSASNGLARQHNGNNHRQSYTTQMERLTLRSKARASTSNGDSIEPDSAILSVIRGNGSDHHQTSLSQRSLNGNRNHRRSLNQHQQQLLGECNDLPCSPNYRPVNDLNRRRRTRSGGVHQQITVVDQMAAQPHIPYAILPKRFEPKQIPSNGLQQQSRALNNNNNNNANLNGGNRRRRAAPRRSQRQPDFYNDQWEDEDEEDLWLEPMPPMMRRRANQRPSRGFAQPAGFYGPRAMPRLDDYYDSFAYGPMPRQGQASLRSRRRMMYQDDGYVPFDIVPSYDLNEWQGPYARSRQSMYMQQSRGGPRYGRDDNGFIRDDHRSNGQSRRAHKSLTPTRNGKQVKSPKSKGANSQHKRRNSRQRKQRNQNSKTEGTPLINGTDLKLTLSHETSDDDKHKHDSVHHHLHTEQPLPPRDHDHKENDS